jgi:hypothetical protein
MGKDNNGLPLAKALSPDQQRSIASLSDVRTNQFR